MTFQSHVKDDKSGYSLLAVFFTCSDSLLGNVPKLTELSLYSSWLEITSAGGRSLSSSSKLIFSAIFGLPRSENDNHYSLLIL